jgi:zinc D-Ala-D-Ala carboxypeptidase
MENLKHFNLDEFDCPSGEAPASEFINKDFLVKLNSARHSAGVPFVINSGVRSPEHNEQVGGKEFSSHLSTTEGGACAADIAATDSVTRWKIIKSLVDHKFNRIGIAKTFIHVDDDKSKPSGVCWLY